jgi:glycosyltransferase involved in cell wall biosynthesis
MHILMVCARYLPFLGGIETHVDEVGSRIERLGHTVDVLTTDPSGALPCREYRNRMAITRVRAYPKHRDYYFAPGIYHEIVRRRRDYDVIHFQGYNNFVPIIGMLTALYNRIPYVLTFHSGGHPSRFRNAIRGTQQKLLSPLAARAAQLIGVSEFEATLFSRSMGIARDRITVIRNGASVLPPSAGITTNPNLIMSIGRLERYKGHHRAIEAFPHLLRMIPEARLMIVGAGPYEAALRALVRELKLPDTVAFQSIPPAERQRFSNLLHTAGLVVLLSEYEANPLAVMEALAARRRVLVAYTSGLKELADAGWCVPLPIDASPKITADMMAIQLHQRQEMAAFPVHTWDDCARQLLDVYAAVQARGHSAEGVAA